MSVTNCRRSFLCPAVALVALVAPGAFGAKSGPKPAVQISNVEVQLSNSFQVTVSTVSPGLRRSVNQATRTTRSAAPVSGRGRGAEPAFSGSDALDLDSFSYLIDSKGGTTFQRAVSKRWTVSLAGQDLFIEDRESEAQVLRVSWAALWPALLAGHSDAILKSASLNYDHRQDRWLLSGTVDLGEDTNKSAVLIAVSASGNPTDLWKAYRVDSAEDAMPVNPAAALIDGSPVLSVSWLARDAQADDQVPEPVAYSLTNGDAGKGAGAMKLATSGSFREAIPASSYITPNNGTGVSQNFFAYFSDLDGASTITFAGVLINSTLGGSNGCVIYYDGSSKLGLVNDGNTATNWVTPGTPSSAVLSNSQCTLKSSNSFINKTGTTLYLALDLTFKPGFGGTKAMYQYVRDATDEAQWQVKGYWTIPTTVTPPIPGNVAPGSGYGFNQEFIVPINDATGANAVNFAGLLINNGLNGVGACLVYYAGGTQLGLVNDSNTNVSYINVGTSETTSNSQCTLSGVNSYIFPLNSRLELNINLSFKPSFGGLKNVYVYARNNAASSDWVEKGTWGVPATLTPPRPESIQPASGAGDEQAFLTNFRLPGNAPLGFAGLLINSTLNGVNGCVIYYLAPNQIGLVNDANSAVNYITIGSNNTASNSQCTLDAQTSTVQQTGGNLALSLALKFKPSFNGTKTTYGYARDNNGTASGWIALGNWSIVGNSIAPMPTQISPTSGAGSANTFFSYYLSPTGAASITTAGLLINSTLTGVNSCLVYYYGGNQLCLANNANSATSCVTTGVNADVSNSQCTLKGSLSSLSLTGTTLRIAPFLVFNPGFNGVKNTYSFATSGANSSGWTLFGTWTVQ